MFFSIEIYYLTRRKCNRFSRALKQRISAFNVQQDREIEKKQSRVSSFFFRRRRKNNQLKLMIVLNDERTREQNGRTTDDDKWQRRGGYELDEWVRSWKRRRRSAERNQRGAAEPTRETKLLSAGVALYRSHVSRRANWILTRLTRRQSLDDIWTI